MMGEGVWRCSNNLALNEFTLRPQLRFIVGLFSLLDVQVSDDVVSSLDFKSSGFVLTHLLLPG